MAIATRALEQVIDSAGRPVVAGYIYYGEYGKDPKLNPVAVYADEELSVELDNPLRTDIYGRPTATPHVGTDYSYEITDIFGNTVEGPYNLRIGVGVLALNSTPLVFESVDALRSVIPQGSGALVASKLIGARAITQGYYAGSSLGGQHYLITTLAAERSRRANPVWVPDGWGEFYLGGSNVLVAVIVSSGMLSPAHFGARMDGVTNDTVAFSALLDRIGTTGEILDGLNRSMLLTHPKSWSPAVPQRWRRINIINGTTFTDQYQLTITTDVDFHCESLVMDAGRNTKSGLEPWHVFVVRAGINSIQPSNGRFIRFTYAGKVKPVRFDYLQITNFHGDVGLGVSLSHGLVEIVSGYFENCSNKQFHVWHGVDGGAQPDAGCTILHYYYSKNCGMLPAAFSVSGVPKTRADPYAPQGAFGALVTYGRYFIGNAFVNNYGSSAITADRNRVFVGGNIQILHTEGTAFSNNPSGAFWNEFCGKCLVDKLEILVRARDPRETAMDNSLVQIGLQPGQIQIINNLVSETTSGANISKNVRGSLDATSELIINGGRVRDAGATWSVRILNSAGTSTLVSLSDMECTGAPCDIGDSNHVRLTNFTTDSSLAVRGSTGAIGDVTLTNCRAAGLTVSGSNGRIEIDGGACTANLAITSTFGSSFTRARISRIAVTGTTVVTGGKELVAGNGMTTERRIEVRDVTTALVTGGIFKTASNGESIVWFNPTAPGIMLRAAALANAVYIKTGTTSAGYVTFNANVGSSADVGNDKGTMAWL